MKDIFYSFLRKRKSVGRSNRLIKFSLILFCYMLTTGLYAQQRSNISGNIVDEMGEPVIGVSIKVVGENTGTITDLDGKFSLAAPSNGSLAISYLGYLSQTVAINNKTVINVVLKEDLQKLDEVIVIGYGSVKKRDLTGAVSSVKAEDIVLSPGSNPMQALQGRVAGLDITRTSGQPGEGVDMLLRGTRSFSAKTDPLFIIDGLPGNYSTLNPNDIESIEVLKDASSTAVYGSAGANGVIIITTKKAKEGKPVINFNSYIGLNGFSKVPKVRRGESYMQALREANKATGNWSSTEDDHKLFSSADTYQAYLDNKWIDWADEALQTGYETNNSVSISGGNDKTTAYVSLNFSNEVGQYSNDNYKLYSTNIRVDHKVNNNISAGISLQGSYTHQNKRGSVKLDRALAAIPLGELYDENGNLNKNPIPGNTDFISILADEQSGVYKNQKNVQRLYVNPYIEWKPIKGLSILSRFNGSLKWDKSGTMHGTGSYNYYQNGRTDANTNTTRNYNYTWENIATYNFKVANDHEFTLTGVTSWSHEQEDYSYLYGEDITDNKYLWHNLAAASNVEIESKYTMLKKMGYVGRLNYSYLGRYLFSASFRHEGASVLAKGHQWDTYPAFSAGWRINEENFMASTKDWLSNLKLRVGWGISGSANIESFRTRSTLDQKYLSIGNKGLITYLPSQFVDNPNLGWEKSTTTNIGLDLGFLNGRIDLSADYYITNTKDVIIEVDLPSTSGTYDSATTYKSYMNLCKTRNTGFEITLNTRNIVTKEFTWSSTLTFATNKEEIKALTSAGKKELIQDKEIWRVGEAIHSYYNYEILGVWQNGEEADAAVFGKKPGDYKLATDGLTRVSDGVYVDAEGNEYTEANKYTYSAKDYKVLGHNTPDWTAGLQNTFTYKDFDLTVYLYARWGQMIKYDLLGSYDPSGVGNFPEYFDYWTETNAANDFPAIRAGEQFKNYEGYAARPYVNGSFFKIKNITLGYTLPANILKKIQIDKLRVYGTITNPVVIAKSDLLKDYDPEMNGKLDYPLTKQIVFGINLTF